MFEGSQCTYEVIIVNFGIRLTTWIHSVFYSSYYRPQTKFAKVMFLHLSVSHSVHRGVDVCLSACWDTHPQADTPQADPPGHAHPWAHTPLDRHPLGRHPPSWHPLGRHCLQVDTPLDRHPPGQCMLGDTGNKRAERILLVCILVSIKCSPTNTF